MFAFSPENVSKKERLVFELGLGSFQVTVPPLGFRLRKTICVQTAGNVLTVTASEGQMRKKMQKTEMKTMHTLFTSLFS